LRSSGHSLDRVIQDISDDIAAYMICGSLIPIFLYCIYLLKSESGLALWLWAVGIGFTLFLTWKVMTLIERRRRLRVGLAGEKATGEELNRLMLEGYHVYHDFPADGFNIDHILVGRSGVFAVETKARSKGSSGRAKSEAVVIYDGNVLRFPSAATSEPIVQAKAQAAWLAKWLNGAVGDPVKVTPIVTIPGWYINRKTTDGIQVLNPKEVKIHLDGEKELALSRKMIKRICHQLEQKCRDVDLWDWY
jgi:hypothetical protein